MRLLLNDGFVEICQIEFGSPEYFSYSCMIEGYWTNNVPLGFGEAAAMALALKHCGIVSSNNLSDVKDLGELDEIPILTFSMIMSFCFELNLMSEGEIEVVWRKILNTTNQKLPTQTFKEYYNELFKKDRQALLKGYDFKKHYYSSKK